jgi:hypothetical protein
VTGAARVRSDDSGGARGRAGGLGARLGRHRLELALALPLFRPVLDALHARVAEAARRKGAPYPPPAGTR